MGKRRNRPNTLNLFLKALLETEVIIELRNETTIKGIIDVVDDSTNIMLNNAHVKRPHAKQSEQFERLFVVGRHIRYIQTPEMDVDATLESHKQFLDRVKNIYRRGTHHQDTQVTPEQ